MYKPANMCIYCRTVEVPLSREHIIPYSLGGSLVLPKASCRVHAAITSEIERQVARVAYGVFRAQNGAPSRHSSKLGDVLAQRVSLEGETFDGEKVEILVPVEKVPPVSIFVQLAPPGILSGWNEDSLVGPDLKIKWTPESGALRKLRKASGLKKLYGPAARFPLRTYERFLAKVAHAYACAERGLLNFSPYLLPLILGDDEPKSWHCVGGFDPALPQGTSPLVLREVEHRQKTLLVVEISLRFLPRLPRYQVVCGHLI